MDGTSPITIFIDQTFCGPPNSGNGGYVCGMLAKYIPGVAEVSLRQPPPLNTSMRVELKEGKAFLFDQDTLVAEAKPTHFDLDIPAMPDFMTAEVASKGYAGFKKHYFPTCFVCGPGREAGDGLRIFAGPTPDGKMVAATWMPADALFDMNGKLLTEYYWAALDCPGAYAIHETKESMKVLGRISTKIVEVIRPGEKIIVTGWQIGAEGRKFYSGTALFNEEGTLKAFAKAIWIEIPGDAF